MYYLTRFEQVKNSRNTLQSMFLEGNVSTVSIVQAGGRSLVNLMDSRECDTFNELCSTKFCQNLLIVRVLLVR